MVQVASKVTRENFKLFKAVGLGMLEILINVVRTIATEEKELYPLWQGSLFVLKEFDSIKIR